MAAQQQTIRQRISLGNNADIPMAIAVIGIMAVLIIPLPQALLDVLLTLNISISVVVLLATLYLQRAVDFAIFPSLLLMLTLFRLSLNVASTRLILAEADAGKVIAAFGIFVTKGNMFVGIVIFIILVVIQFVVITKGATRISEVAARFTLDAMPGKQMGVDSDLNAGLITEDVARKRRRDIEREADFYGAMDGATKFVRGDAVAGIIITIVNITVGFIIGMLMLGLDAAESARIYTQLTIGDGLVSQIPSLLVSTAAGLVVTRTVSEEGGSLGADFQRSFAQYPRAMGVAAVMLSLFAVVPGMPRGAFLLVAALFGLMAYVSAKTKTQREAAAAREEEASRTIEQPEPERRTEDLLTVDPLKIELGYGLITLADARQGGDLLSRIQIIRQQIATQMGYIVPVIRIVDNMRLRPNEYVVKLRESEIARYEIYPDSFLAMNPGLVEETIPGLPTVEPAFGLQATWVPREARDRAERLGYTIIEPSAVLATHITELLHAYAEEIVTREDVQLLLKHLKETSPTVVDELVPNILTYGDVQRVLQNLLRERVSIRNLEVIIETLCDYGRRTKDLDVLTEYCRHALAREISALYADEDRTVRVVTVAPDIEQEILRAAQQSDGDYVPLAPERADAIGDATLRAVNPLLLEGHEAVVLTSAPVRRFFRRVITRYLPKIIVLSYNEIDPAKRLESVGQITV